MPGLDLGHLSSNWKKLQTQLQADRKAKPPPTNGLKRKHAADKPSKPSNGHPNKPKKARLTGDNTTALGARRRKMGSSLSSQAPPPPTSSHSTLTKDHDIPAADLATAYGSSSATSRKSFQDEINSGLHPTHKAGKFLALDCEMVGTGPPPHSDDVLARVSLVNFHGEQIYDSYVQPPKGVYVSDYRTFVSGITPKLISPADGARTFQQVQKDVADLLQDRILVGHALRKDLQSLILSHPKRDTRDTSRYAPFRVESRGKPPALRNLAKSELGMEIQTGEHSSVEDARATMALFRKEKRGFEEENRRTFGQRRRAVEEKGRGKKGADIVGEGRDEGDSEEDEDEDLDTLDGEEEDEEEEDGEGVQGAAAPKGKKKRKKKKRTKRR